jgi:hypothetical protein
MSWFSKHKHGDPLDDLIDEFLIGSDLEAKQMLKEHEGILLTFEVVKRIEKKLPSFQEEYQKNPGIMEKFNRHYAFLKNAQEHGLEKAIEKVDQENKQAEWACQRFLTLDDDALPVFIRGYQNILSSPRVISVLKHIIDANRKQQGNDWFKQSKKRLQLLKDLQKPGIN